MNILETIMGKILPHRAHAQNPNPAGQSATTAQPSPLQQSGTGFGAAGAASHVDVEEVLRGMQRNNSQKLDWRNSIVDLMKMLGMDSDMASRRQLAKELNYTGDMNDSAKMNVWLHQQVMKKLEENGGKIPDAMKH